MGSADHHGQGIEKWLQDHGGVSADGTELLHAALLRDETTPLAREVRWLLDEVGAALGTIVTGMPRVTQGANHNVSGLQSGSSAVLMIGKGFHLTLAHKHAVIARLSRNEFQDGQDLPTIRKRQNLIAQCQFELAVYDMLQPFSDILGRYPLYHRVPERSRGEPRAVSDGLSGRCLLVFAKAEGERYEYTDWRALSAKGKVCHVKRGVWSSMIVLMVLAQSRLLRESARIAATIFRFPLCSGFVSTWLCTRLVDGSCSLTPNSPIAPTRAFCIQLVAARVEACLRRSKRQFSGGPRGLRDGITCAAVTRAKDLILEAIPCVMPRAIDTLSEVSLYRFVLEHGDFGIHNMTVRQADPGVPEITSVYDWEAGRIVPAVLSEPKMVVTADLVLDEEARPAIRRWGDGDSPEKLQAYQRWSMEYFEALFEEVPECEAVARAGRDARYLWRGLDDLVDMSGAGLEARLVALGSWAEAKLGYVSEKQVVLRVSDGLAASGT